MAGKVKKMRMVNYEECGAVRYFTEDKNAPAMDIYEEISRAEFQKKFPDAPLHSIHECTAVFLENGSILLDSEWNGEVYTVKENGRERTFKPLYAEADDDDVEIVGYYEV